ncbi:MAG: DUF1499 domain-containing protein [Burkholderiales bacterium]
MSLFSFAGKRPSGIGVRGARLAPCPASPNCVCSDETGAQHAITPFRLKLPAAQAWAAAREAVLAQPRTTIVTEGPDYVHAECASALFGYVDDLELHLRADENIIAIRSASRLGHSDFGVNRKRVERLRSALSRQGAIE